VLLSERCTHSQHVRGLIPLVEHYDLKSQIPLHSPLERQYKARPAGSTFLDYIWLIQASITYKKNANRAQRGRQSRRSYLLCTIPLPPQHHGASSSKRGTMATTSRGVVPVPPVLLRLRQQRLLVYRNDDDDDILVVVLGRLDDREEEETGGCCRL